MNSNADYYVYCYIDPRNYEVFYYGKGTGNRSHAHLLDQGKSAKAERIKQILKETERDPIIRVVATNLTQEQAFLVEATLIWNSGDRLTNGVSGHFVSKFRPQYKMHRRLEGFDFSRRIHFFNVGEAENHRSWDDCRAHGFISAGYGLRYKKQAQQLHTGDIAVAYLSKHGYVGIGRVIDEAVRARDFLIGNKPLAKVKLNARNICHDSDDRDKCEYVIKIKWLVAKKREDAIWKNGLFTARQIRASLEKQPKTLRYIENEWGKKFEDILD